MCFLDNYEDLEVFLEVRENRVALKDAIIRDFYTFYVFAWLYINRTPVFEPNHIKEAIETGQKIADGELDTAWAMFWPPGFGKTQILIYWMAWCLIRNPSVKFLYTNCVFSAVKERGAELMGVISALEFITSIGIARLSSSRTQFRIKDSSKRSGYVGVAFEGGITGLDAGNPNAKDPDWMIEEVNKGLRPNKKVVFIGALVVDDPLSASHFRSETRKQTCRDIYNNTLRRRCRAHAKPVFCFQRLAIDDLGATAKEHHETGLDEWTFHEVKCLLPSSKSAWERMVSTKNILAMSNAESMQEVFNAQYQQNPIVPSGNIIKADWFREFKTNDLWTRRDLRREAFITADTAIGTKKGNDYTVFCFWIWLDDGLYLMDMIRGQWDLPTQVKQAKMFWHKHRELSYMEIGGVIAKKMMIEDALHGIGLLQILRDQGIVAQTLEADKDKVARAQEAAPYIESGLVFLPIDKPKIVSDVKNECVCFTHDDSHAHDDIVDNLAYAVRLTWFKVRTKIHGHDFHR